MSKIKISIIFFLFFLVSYNSYALKFINGLEDIPLYKKMEYVEDSLILFDKIDGRYVSVEINGDYLHAEATSKWMKYVDDLEVSFLPESNILLIRSESRVGESDLGVNQKRVNLLRSKLF